MRPRAARRRLVAALLVLQAGSQPAIADEPIAPGGPLDPDDVAALVADLEASGGELTAADLALLEEAPDLQPARTASWFMAVGARRQAPPRLDAGIQAHGARWAFQGRLRRDAGGPQGIAWLRGGGAAWDLAGGGGAFAHGAGLVAGPLGARSSPSPDASLLPAAAGWRPQASLVQPARLVGGAAAWRTDLVALDAGLARDRDGHPAGHARAELHGPAFALAAAGLRRGEARAGCVEWRGRRGPWTLVAEAATWRLADPEPAARAWLAAGGWRGARLRLECQVGVSRAASPMPGAARPTCLSGWLGQGWTLRAVLRPARKLVVSAIAAAADDREADDALGRRHDRRVLALAANGRWAGDGTWELRLRRVGEAWRDWDPHEPWRPAQDDGRRERVWLSAEAARPLAVGQCRLGWRRLEEAGRARDLLAATWERRQGTVRWRIGLQLAWGAPLNLVAVAAPVAGLVRLRDWGRYESGVLAGCEGRGAWRWQIGLEGRQRTAAAGGGFRGELRVQWGRSF